MNDLLSALTNASKAFNDSVIKEKKETADAELRQQEANLWKFKNEFFEELNHRTDTDFFLEDFEGRLGVEKDIYNKKYKSEYQARKGNELFLNLETESRVALDRIIKEREKDLAKVLDLDAANTYKKGPATQVNLDKEVNQYHWLAEDRSITKEQELSAIKQAVTDRRLQAGKKVVDDFFFDEVTKTPEMTDEEYRAKLISLEIPILTATFEGNLVDVDMDAIHRTIVDYGMQRLHDYKTVNNQKIYDTNTNIIFACKDSTSDNELELKAAVEGQIQYIKSLSNLQLNEDDYRARLFELQGLQKIFEEEPSEERSTKIKVEANKALIKADPNTFIQGARIGSKNTGSTTGYKNLYTAYTAYKQVMMEQSGKPENQTGIEEMVPFFDAAKRQYKNIPDVVGLLNTVEKLTNKYASDEKYEELYAEMLDYTWDLIFETDMSNFDAAALKNQINKKLEVVVATELKDKKIALEKVGNKGAFGRLGYDLNKAISNLEENDYAYTDMYGRTRVTDNAVDELNEKVIPEMARALFAIGAVQPEVDILTTSESMYDVDLNPQFKDKNNNVYKFKSTEDGYIIYKNGKEYATEEKVREQWKTIDTQRREEIDQQIESLKVKQKGLANDLKDRKQQNADLLIELANNPDVPIAHWNTMSQKEKIDALTKLRATDYEQYMKIVKQSKAN